MDSPPASTLCPYLNTYAYGTCRLIYDAWYSCVSVIAVALLPTCPALLRLIGSAPQCIATLRALKNLEDLPCDSPCADVLTTLLRYAPAQPRHPLTELGRYTC